MILHLEALLQHRVVGVAMRIVNLKIFFSEGGFAKEYALKTGCLVFDRNPQRSNLSQTGRNLSATLTLNSEKDNSYSGISI